MTHELLGTHKPSPEWYTPDFIWEKIQQVFDNQSFYDPCPRKGTNGLESDWGSHQFIYCNPPTPAASWALKAVETHQLFNNTIIFAAFSESVIWQVNKLLDYRHVFVRNRIQWIDGRTGKKSTSPRNYNVFICISSDESIKHRFNLAFGDIGTVRESLVVNNINNKFHDHRTIATLPLIQLLDESP